MNYERLASAVVALFALILSGPFIADVFGYGAGYDTALAIAGVLVIAAGLGALILALLGQGPYTDQVKESQDSR